MQTAVATIATLAASAAESLPPGLDRAGKLDPGGQAARAGQTAATLQQWGSWAGDLPLVLSDLALVYPILGGRASSDGPTRSRRHTCRQLGALAERLAGEVPATQAEQIAAISRAITVWEAIRDRCDPADPRHRAIATRCEEEIATLRGPDGLGALA